MSVIVYSLNSKVLITKFGFVLPELSESEKEIERKVL
jgi:hypothetical protein